MRLMVGRSIDQVFPKRDSADRRRGALRSRASRNATEFDDISFTLRKGEILGFYGLVGAGRSEAMQCLFGLTRSDARARSARGQADRPSARRPTPSRPASPMCRRTGRTQGAVLPLGIRENTTLACLAQHVARRSSCRAAPSVPRRAALGSRLAVKAVALGAAGRPELSGGNQQKVVIAKWLATKPKVIILDEPTKGIDIGSKAAVHDFMANWPGEGSRSSWSRPSCPR